MALVVKDRVKETTTTTGTGTITLAGAVDGFQSFSAALSDGDTTYYAISETSTGEWEVGLGTFTATGTTLARTTILASSNSGSAVSLTSEADVFITQPAGKSVFFDGSGDLTLNQDPTSALHAATKEYVDTIAAAGLHYHDPVRVEQEGNLSATYDNGTAGVGATLTNNSTQAALSIDGVTLSLNDRVLIYEQTNAFENGVYTVTDTGSAITNWVLTRATDADSYAPSDPDSLGQGDAFFVLEGTAGAGELYVMNTEGTITFGTTGITFTQVAATAVFTAGDGLTLTGTTFAVGAGTGVTVNANDIAIGQAVGTSDSPTFAGMTTTADITFGTDDKASFGTTLDVYSDGTDSYVVESGTGNLYIDSADLSIRNAAGTATMASFDDTGSVTLNHNNSTKFTTQSYGIDVTGNVQADGLVLAGDATFGDNDKAIFGAGSDLQIYHDGSNSFIKDNGTGNLLIQGATDIVLEDTSGANYFRGVSGSYVRLYHNNSTKLETTSTGVDITGTLTSDGLTVGIGDNIGVNAGNGFSVDASSNIDFTSGGVKSLRIKEGDISFYEDTGTTAKFFWDASAESLGIGTTSPSASIHAYHATTNVVGTFESGDADVYITLADNTTTSDTAMRIGVTGNDMHFSTSATERMRIDSSGNLLVGTTSTSIANTGLRFSGASDYLAVTRASDAPLILNRTTSDGDIAEFRKDNTTVGSIGVVSGDVYMQGPTDHSGIQFNTNGILPLRNGAIIDDTLDIGGASYRWQDLYLSGAAYTHSIAKQTTNPIVINSTLSSSKALRVYYDMDIYNTINFTDASWANQGYIVGSSGNLTLTATNGVNGVKISGNTVWHAGNDGSGSGLDADTVDGIQASSFLRSDVADTATKISFGTGNVQAPTPTDASTGARLILYPTGSGRDYALGIEGSTMWFNSDDHYKWYVDGSLKFEWDNAAGQLEVGGNKVWHAGNDGSGSGLDADLLDGYQLSTTRNAPATVPVRDGNGYLQLGWINTTSGVTTSGSINKIYASYDDYVRYVTPNFLADTVLQTLNKQDSSYYDASTWVNFGPSNGSGLYWNTGTGAGWHIYPVDSASMRLQSGSSSYSAIRFNTNGTDRNYVYNDSSNQIGFLNTSGSWILRTTNSGEVHATSFHGDGSNLTNLPAASGITSSSTINIQTTGSTSDIRLRTTSDGEVNVESGSDILWSFNGSASGGDAYYDTTKASLGTLWERLYMNNYTTYPVHQTRHWASSSFSGKPVYTQLKYIFDAVNNTFDSYMSASAFGGVGFAVPVALGSDIKLKESVSKIESPLDKLSQINGYDFTWKKTGRRDAGVIAQEIEEVMPHLVNYLELPDDENTDESGHKTVNYNGLIGLLIEALKEQQSQINALQDKLGVSNAT